MDRNALSNALSVLFHPRRLGGWAMVLGGVLLGCSGDTTGPAPTSPATLFWTVQLNEHAINLAVTPPFDTIRLVATARNAAGTPLSTVGPITYRGTDSTVTVDSTGLVTAHYTTSGTHVIASMTVNGVSLVDTAVIQVTPTPFAAPLATFSIQPQPDGLDSAKIAVFQESQLNQFNGNIPVYATIATGDPKTDTVCNVNGCGGSLAVFFASSDSTIAYIDKNGFVTTYRPGRVTFSATTWAYGVAKRDTLPFVIGYTIRQNLIFIRIQDATGHQRSGVTFSPPTDTVGVGSRVFFGFQDATTTEFSNDTVDVVFEDSTAVMPGVNVLIDNNDINNNNAFISFPGAGTYPYHSRRYGIGGTIVVSSGP